MAGDWLKNAMSELDRLRVGSDGWAYRDRGEPYVEPTVLAALAHLAHDSSSDRRKSLTPCADWLSAIQNDNGSVGVATSLPTPNWPTALAILLWNAIGGYQAERQRAVGWLLSLRGTTYPRETDDPIGHDQTIVGWPWVESTHSWVEPTSWSIMALRREKRARDDRVREGLRLLRDRAIATGGWNYGNNVVFGRVLRPQPAPTGLALLAMSGVSPRGQIVGAAAAYLEKTLPDVRSPQSLCWGLLALEAWGRAPDDRGRWLAEAFDQSRGRSDLAPQMAYLLLAAGGRASLPLLGLEGGSPS